MSRLKDKHTTSLFDEPTEEARPESEEDRQKKIEMAQKYSIQKHEAATKLISLGNEVYASMKGKPWMVVNTAGAVQFMHDGELISLARRLS